MCEPVRVVTSYLSSGIDQADRSAGPARSGANGAMPETGALQIPAWTADDSLAANANVAERHGAGSCLHECRRDPRSGVDGDLPVCERHVDQQELVAATG